MKTTDCYVEIFNILRATCCTAINREICLPEDLNNLAEDEWRQLLHLSQIHRVTPLLNKALTAENKSIVPEAIGHELQDLCRRNTARNLLLWQRLESITNLLRSDHITFVPIKGTLLAKQLYGDISMRQVDDLDLLISKDDLARSSSLLEKHGFTAVHPTESLPFLIEHGWDWPMKDPSECFHVDLSASLAAGYLCLPQALTDHITASALPSRVSGVTLPLAISPGGELLLAVHGWKHGWSRLSWSIDFTTAIYMNKNFDVNKFLSLADRFKCLGIAKNALLVAKEWFPELTQQINLHSSRHADSLREQMAKVRTTPDIIPNPPINQLAAARERRIDRLMMRLRIMLEPGFGDWRLCPMPRMLWWLYYPLRIARLTGKVIFDKKNKWWKSSPKAVSIATQ